MEQVHPRQPCEFCHRHADPKVRQLMDLPSAESKLLSFQSCPLVDEVLQYRRVCVIPNHFFVVRKSSSDQPVGILLTGFQSSRLTASPLFQHPQWVGEGSQPPWRWASGLRLALAKRWLWHSPAARAKEKPNQWERSPASFSAVHHDFYVYVCFFTCRWAASMAQSCGLQPRAKQVVLSWLSLQASWLARVYLGCCYLCEVGSLFHKLPAGGCWLFAS